ncbi:Uncharacterised protein [Mycobacterium tuberculosis]|uniref:Uncharacterized protein n=1 Tax=Mycobacterium tuberculosis TaxID=1773 RepID=A0A655AD56_MYCTX|nr:Uncharacterised protein [Mycobacterium tuberculosis]CKP22815.1 Uncharacterised protein [Mycobacterium tuberculosis]CKS45881.1 Uncharacterised protein [Mycobacterium tuberculosis]CKS89979.1 Uncharacterised protein [Mycobacterium tuberculosis]CNV10363.1 Uncharacterised protein [Mycobacterium tuberculosis]
MRASANMSHNHFRDSGEPKNNSFLTSRGMSNSSQNALGGTTIALHNDRIVRGK